ncbi:YusW family protein [Viridibacillus sp. NPDC096237]|uniref:YusW family protein n=1 Tax=Viridibacillus sp. NPDC096237 TaxID=3390721 RepID=UPI003D06CD3C
MKYLKMALGIPLLFGMLYGCGKEKATDVPEKAPIEQKETDTNMHKDTNTNNNVHEGTNHTTENLPYHFADFSLDIEYSSTESYEVDYKNEKTGVKVELDDDRNNVKLKGDEALAKLEPMFKKLKFDAKTANDEVINHVISVFDLDKNYTSFELEVKFADGTEKEYKKTK